MLPEIFATRDRNTGAGLSLNLAGIVGGAIPPLVAGVLWPRWAVGAMMASFVVAGIISTVLLPETKGTELDAVVSNSAR